MLENLEFFVDYCNKLEPSSVIIVEGKRDIKTLLELGVKCKIVTKAGMDINTLVDKVLSYKHIIILTDFDQEGIRLQKKLKAEISRRKGHSFIDTHARHILYKFAKANSSLEIEDLHRFIPLINFEKPIRKVK